MFESPVKRIHSKGGSNAAAAAANRGADAGGLRAHRDAGPVAARQPSHGSGLPADFSKISACAAERQDAARPAPARLSPPTAPGPALAVGEMHDALEHAADRIAGRVMNPAGEDRSSETARAPSTRGAVPAGDPRPLRRRTANSLAAFGTGAPPIVHEVLRSSGQPLDAGVRSFMEPRFGIDFGGVRVFNDARAAESARAMNALAFTVGQNVVFGAGQYAPLTAAGRRLLAHELTHVIQRDSVLRRQVGPNSAVEARQFVQSAIGFLDTGAEIYRADLRSKGAQFDDARLQRQFNGWGQTLEKAQNIINSTLGKDAVLTQSLRAAYQSAVKAAVSFVMDRNNLTDHAAYEKYRLQIAEWALPQATADPSASELSGSLSQTERKRLTVITGTVVFGLEDLFSTKTAKTTIPLPTGVTVRFAGGVAARLRDGLRNVAATILPKPLELNSTMTLALDLGRYGGGYSAYRFTYVEHKPRKGKATREVLIERLGAIGLDELSQSQVTAAQAKFDAHHFTRGTGWSDAQFETTLAAIAQISGSILTPVDGLTFNRDRVDRKDPTTGGHYEPDTHTIVMFDRAFADSTTRFGMPGGGVSPDSVRAVAHEIGHAVDLVPLRRIWASLEQRRGVLSTAFARFEDPPGSGNYSFPHSEQARFNRLQADIAMAEQAVAAARSESGQRYQQGAGGTWDTVQGRTAAGSIAFRQAAQQDGGKRITAYANKEWQEYYAEAFSLYITDPVTLQRLRPKVFAFFAQNHPK